MKIFVTGGSGLIGQELIKELLKENFSVKALQHSTAVLLFVRFYVLQMYCFIRIFKGSYTGFLQTFIQNACKISVFEKILTKDS